jgi:high affinity sulfate transporter 1
VKRALVRFVPGVQVARTYQAHHARADLLAGLGLIALLVPQGMAYAQLAGLPPVTGLYTTVTALLVYAVLGPSRTLVLGPDSALGPLIAAAVLPLVGAGGNPPTAIALAGMLALLMGLLCVAAGFARLGVLAELLSKPVRIGFLNGIAIVVFVSQLPHLFGFSSDAQGLADEATAFARGVRDGETVPAALAVGLVSLGVILLLRRLRPGFPGVFVAIVGAGLVTAALDLSALGVDVVGEIPSGLPAATFPDVGLANVGTLLVAAAGMAFVTLTDTAVLSRSLAAKHGESVDVNQELVALGTANLAAGVFQGFPVSASSTRTAVAEASGSRTQMTGVVGAVGIIIVLVAAAGLGTYMPMSALAAVVIAAAFALFDLRDLVWLGRVRRSEFMLSCGALLGVAILGVLPGIAVAIALSLGDFVRRAWRPYDAVLGRIPGRKGYHDVDRHPEAVQIPGLVLLRFDAPLFFANAAAFADRLLTAVDRRDGTVRWVIVAAEPITDIDTTAAEVLDELLDELQRRHIQLAFAALKGPAKDRLRGYGLYDRIGDRHFFPTIGTSINGYLAATGTDWTDWTDWTESR